MGDQQHTSSCSAHKRRVAVIGAGVSGLAAAKCLLDEELVPVVFEQAADIGGVWKYHEELPTSADMKRALEDYRSHPANRSPVPMFVPLIEYSDEIAGLLGVRPVIWRHPRELLRWFLGPFTAQHYRLDGPGKL